MHDGRVMALMAMGARKRAIPERVGGITHVDFQRKAVIEERDSQVVTGNVLELELSPYLLRMIIGSLSESAAATDPAWCLERLLIAQRRCAAMPDLPGGPIALLDGITNWQPRLRSDLVDAVAACRAAMASTTSISFSLYMKRMTPSSGMDHGENS